MPHSRFRRFWIVGSDSKFNSIAKEGASTFSGAFQNYKLNNSPSASTSIADLTPYINFVTVDTTTQIDYVQTATTLNCSTANRLCLQLHNGAIVYYYTGGLGTTFGDTSATSAISFWIDPDGKVTTTGAAGTPGKSVEFWLYANGRLTTRTQIPSNSYSDGGGPYGPIAGVDPPWFSWSN